MPKQTKTAKLLYAASESSADSLYFSQAFVPDPFIALGIGSKRIGVVSMLEYSRLAKASALTDLFSLEEMRDEAERKFKVKSASPADIVRLLARRFGFTEVQVPYDFPAGLAEELKERKIKVQTVAGTLFPQRIKKTADEAEKLKQGNAASAAGIRAAERAIRASKVQKNGKLHLNGKVLTSERLRTIIDMACLEKGAVASHTICAGGRQACDPHEGGHGPLRAGELIIVDVFPRVTATGYHGDMTRTFLKGRATESQRALVETVREAQKRSLDALKGGVSGKAVHRAGADYFETCGYKTEQIDGVWQGFIHSTGHGLGLEVHEEPRVSIKGNRLAAGTVVTIEPGLYYPDIGGCRIEDVAWIQKDGYELLSNYHYRWEIR
ncbi:Xaa-Pro peptidase family protein [Rubellicoccus peritrichatus]|uniref:Xaa-Pro peptidase family protein n=1 Tax=Rubellicoccus peritrichatus TaxID=3080537 RepID=A0AAQ3LIC7_9BACT|nr:Xaa-Pro peptidase family protein [Puniceicoccus sp. CR14]WOO42619.1 Xaa-Pro peptidase family protein [Puniceicoccus sp. CR14]